MTLTDAKAVADNPSSFTPGQWQAALDRLEPTACNGGVRNSDRATERLEGRLQRLRDYLAAVESAKGWK